MITLYAFRVRDERTGKWRVSRYKMTPEHAKAQYGEGNYELIEDFTEDKIKKLEDFFHYVDVVRGFRRGGGVK